MVELHGVAYPDGDFEFLANLAPAILYGQGDGVELIIGE
jgi:hypothetical protein